MDKAKFKKDGSLEFLIEDKSEFINEGMLVEVLKRKEEKELLNKLEDYFVKVAKRMLSSYKVQGLNDKTLKYAELMQDIIFIYRNLKDPNISTPEKKVLIESFISKYRGVE